MQNSASAPNLDDANGHKAIKIKKLRNNFKLKSIRTKLKQRTTVAIYRPATNTRVKAAKNTKTLNLLRNMRKFVAWPVVSLMINEEQSQSRPALYFLQQLPSTYIKGSTNIFVARQVDHARWKTRNIDPKQRNKLMLRETRETKDCILLYLLVSTHAVIDQFSGPYSPVRPAKT